MGRERNGLNYEAEISCCFYFSSSAEARIQISDLCSAHQQSQERKKKNSNSVLFPTNLWILTKTNFQVEVKTQAHVLQRNKKMKSPHNLLMQMMKVDNHNKHSIATDLFGTTRLSLPELDLQRKWAISVEVSYWTFDTSCSPCFFTIMGVKLSTRYFRVLTPGGRPSWKFVLTCSHMCFWGCPWQSCWSLNTVNGSQNMFMLDNSSGDKRTAYLVEKKCGNRVYIEIVQTYGCAKNTLRYPW